MHFAGPVCRGCVGVNCKESIGLIDSNSQRGAFELVVLVRRMKYGYCPY
ncbi:MULTISPECIES: hypothetical protein [Candidatus Ichthyocystis]|uniref:Uncharacterized protein n=1 Tax=Candidatus Ichthyocystis hellenicum TaxID=1561003 RepID=A0A0S4M7N8_9BURK|nr:MULTISPECIES: hypothetical protein [Ichthyocystis]CUT18152.1 hypothetical protein Ark11_1348 [Candidatus Ichthyocystis hellenicum]